MATAPSPTVDAARFTGRWRTSPAANTPGRLVSSGIGGRSRVQPEGGAPAGRVAPSGDEDPPSGHGLCLGDGSTVEHAGTDERLRRRDAQAPVGDAGRHDNAASHDRRPSVHRQRVAGAAPAQSGDGRHEVGLGPEQVGALGASKRTSPVYSITTGAGSGRPRPASAPPGPPRSRHRRTRTGRRCGREGRGARGREASTAHRRCGRRRTREPKPGPTPPAVR